MPARVARNWHTGQVTVSSLPCCVNGYAAEQKGTGKRWGEREGVAQPTHCNVLRQPDAGGMVPLLASLALHLLANTHTRMCSCMSTQINMGRYLLLLTHASPGLQTERHTQYNVTAAGAVDVDAARATPPVAASGAGMATRARCRPRPRPWRDGALLDTAAVVVAATLPSPSCVAATAAAAAATARRRRRGIADGCKVASSTVVITCQKIRDYLSHVFCMMQCLFQQACNVHYIT